MAEKDVEPIEADYVIVGAGSAGCVLANRLSADPNTRVLLLEAGSDDRALRNPRKFISNMWIHIPVGYSKTLKDTNVNWMYRTQPDVNGRVFVWPRGKALGGSSAINGLLYVRGQPEDYDGWRQLGCEGWSWDDLLPYFKRAQHREAAEAGDWHGRDGPLVVTDPISEHPISDAALRACIAAGIPRNMDYNGADQEGVGWFQLTVRNGRRVSAAVGYLHPVMKRPNLQVVTDALASRVVLEGRRASGVEFVRGGERRVARARGEVILAGGAVNSPQLLELSGIGRGDVLGRAGISVQVELPGVGENLQDHYILPMRYRLKSGVRSINEQLRGAGMLLEPLKYLFGRTGILALSSAHVAAFVKSRPELATPDLQFHVLPATTDYGHLAKTGKLRLESRPGLTLAPCHLRPESRGHIHIASSDPAAPPEIVPNYLSARADREAMVAAVRWGRRIAAAEPLAALIDHPLEPAPDLEGDEQLADFAKAAGTTVYHPVGTCRMGRNDMAVVDAHLRVRGLEGLRVIDASVMPTVVSGNTNAAAIMIGEKGSDLVLGRTLGGATEHEMSHGRCEVEPGSMRGSGVFARG